MLLWFCKPCRTVLSEQTGLLLTLTMYLSLQLIFDHGTYLEGNSLISKRSY